MAFSYDFLSVAELHGNFSRRDPKIAAISAKVKGKALEPWSDAASC
jgi:hypothetical protein